MRRRSFCTLAAGAASAGVLGSGRLFAEGGSAVGHPAAAGINRAYFIHGLPKAELHIHLEGLLEPADVIALADRYGLDYPYRTVQDVVARLASIHDLATFIEVYESHAKVLIEPQDFYDLAFRYCVRSQQQGVRRIEFHFDPQLHVYRGIPLSAITEALDAVALDASRTLGLSVAAIMAFNRNRSSESAMELLRESERVRASILGIGLDNPEVEDFPQKFEAVFDRAREMGYRLTSHCDVNQPKTHVHLRDCIELLRVERIDHGVNILDRPELIQLAQSAGIKFTVCPNIFASPTGYHTDYFSICAKALQGMEAHGLPAMINTDDPGLMASTYLNDVYHATADQNGWSVADAAAAAKRSFEVAWITDAEKAAYHREIDAYLEAWADPD